MKKNIDAKAIISKLTNLSFFYTLVAMLALFVVASFLSPSFRTVDNVLTILRQAGLLVLLSMGLTAVVITGNIDLSVAACAALSGCITASLIANNQPIVLGIVAGLAVGAATGLLNGILVGVLNLPSFIATYGTRMLLTGLAIIVMNGGVIYGLNENFQKIATGYVGPVSMILVITIVFVTLLGILYNKTTFGRELYMYGSNANAAKYSGSNTLLILILAFVLSSVCASIGGIVLVARANAADSTIANAYVLTTVAAVVVGGTSMLGGEGGIFGTVIGAIVLCMITNIMNILLIDSNWQNLVIGMAILLMVWIDVSSRKSKMKANK